MRTQDEESFTDFARAAKPWLLTTAWMLAGEASTAEDLVQETLVRVYLKWGRVKDQNPSGYARRVLANLNTDRWRRTRREVLTEQHAERAGRDHGDGLGVDLVRALQQLGPRERACVVLRHYLDLSEQQTAEELGVSVGAVKGYTSRGLATLRPLLREGDDQHV